MTDQLDELLGNNKVSKSIFDRKAALVLIKMLLQITCNIAIFILKLLYGKTHKHRVKSISHKTIQRT